MGVVIGLALIGAGLLTFWAGGWILRADRLKLRPRETKAAPRVAVLVPAREESAVIRGLLASLAQQTWPLEMRDVFVIVERADDPTVAIAQAQGATVIVRQDLTGHPERARKGFALDVAVRQILAEGRHFDAYFVFDADNTMDADYIERLMECYAAGYQMATGYRGAANADENVIAAVSSLTFSMINVLGNRKRARIGANVIFSGTGCLIAGELVEKWQGWPFHSLTEDYEMSLYAILHGLATNYDERASFYDEQPTKYAQTVLQRTRWIKGYFAARREYVPQMRRKLWGRAATSSARLANRGSLWREVIGVKPIIVMIIGAILVLLDGAAKGVALDGGWLGVAAGVLGLIYVALMLVTVAMLKRERLRLGTALEVRTILFNPLYLLTYIWCALKALLTRDVAWARIEHKGKAETEAEIGTEG